MSQAKRLSTADGDPEQPDPEGVIEENRELYERLAEADLSVSERLQAALDLVDEQEESDGSE